MTRWRIRTCAISAFFGLFLAVSDMRAGNGVWTAHGPVGGSIRALAVDASNPNNIYAGTFSGVFRSRDAGDHWEPAGTALKGISITAIAIDPSDAMAVYAAPFDNGILRSTDEGSSWPPVNGGLTNLHVHALAVDPGAPGHVYAATDGGLFKTVDEGASWVRALAQSVQVLTLGALPGTVYAASDQIFKSTDAGATWVVLTANGLSGYVVSLAVDSAGESIYASTAALAKGQSPGLFKLTDGATTWTRLPVSAFLVAADPRTPDKVYAAGGSFLYRSLDGGLSWAKGFAGAPSSINLLVVTAAIPHLVYAGTGIGLFRTGDDGASWIDTNDGLVATTVYAVAVDRRDAMTIYAGTNVAVERSKDGGEHWLRTSVGPSNVTSLAIDPATPAAVYTGTTGSGIWKSIDGGNNWESLSAGLPDDPGVYTIRQLAVDPMRTNIIYAIIGRILQSFDGGHNWTVADDGFGGESVSGLAIDPSDSSNLYAVTDVGRVFKSSDTSATWSLVATIRQIRALAVDPSVPTRIYGYGTGVLVSEDSGSNWQQAGLGSEIVESLIVTTAGLYAGTGTNGVFWSPDRGATWIPVDAGLQSKSIASLGGDTSGLFLHAGTYGGGVNDLRLDARVMVTLPDPRTAPRRRLSPR